MDKRTLTAIGLAIGVLVVWSILFPPPARTPVPAATTPAAAPAEQVPGAPAPGLIPVAPATTAGAAPSPAPGETAGAAAGETPPGTGAAPIAAEKEERVTVETELAKIELTNKGGRAVSWTLERFTDKGNGQHNLVSPATGNGNPDLRPLDLVTGRAEVDKALAAALYKVEKTDGPDGPIVTFAWSNGAGLAAGKQLAFHSTGYSCTVRAEVTEGGRRVPALIVWGPGIGPSLTFSKSGLDQVGYGIIGRADQAEKVSGSLAEPMVLPAGSALWAGIDERYFAAFFLPLAADPAPPGGPNTTGANQPLGAPLPEARFFPVQVLPAPGGKYEEHIALGVATDAPLTLYAGPKEWDRLKAMPGGVEKMVDFGRPTFIPLIGGALQPVIEALAHALYASLRWLHERVSNWGIAIIIVTIGIRLLFFPIMQVTMVKMRRTQVKMQALQPKVKAIQERYKKIKGVEARNKMNQEVMEVYQKEGVNPLSSLTGCLPLLLQLPFLAAFYNVLTVSIELRQAPFFGWITDLSEKDPYWITPILMGATMMLQQKLAMTRVTDPQQRQQQRMMMFMPVMFTFFFLNMPSGLTLYWFVSNVLQIGQQFLINRSADRKIAADAARTA